MTILDEKEWSRLKQAMARREVVKIERNYVQLNASVSFFTREVTFPWPVDMILTVRVKFQGGIWHQHFESVEAAREAIKKWDGWL
jgi:hypothetical protein